MQKKVTTPPTSRTTKDRVADFLSIKRPPARLNFLARNPEIREFVRELAQLRRSGQDAEGDRCEG